MPLSLSQVAGRDGVLRAAVIDLAAPADRFEARCASVWEQAAARAGSALAAAEVRVPGGALVLAGADGRIAAALVAPRAVTSLVRYDLRRALA